MDDDPLDLAGLSGDHDLFYLALNRMCRSYHPLRSDQRAVPHARHVGQLRKHAFIGLIPLIRLIVSNDNGPGG